MACVCVGEDHIVHQTGKHTYNEKSDHNTQPETQKRFRLVDIINSVQLLLSFAHDTGLLSVDVGIPVTIIKDGAAFCKHYFCSTGICLDKGEKLMCGFVGFTNHIDNSNVVLGEMLDKIKHRGPDAEGTYIDEDIALGHRRLSIIDVSDAGTQPLYSEDGNLALLFNGEIYNYQEIRSRLMEAGYHFATQTDSEVLIYGYQEYGAELLQQLRGMFSFVIWDKREKKLFGARDFFGIKPMHYAMVDGSFVYASEIKSILEYPKYKKKFNHKALDNYLSFQYVVPPETFFEGIYCLLPGHYLWYRDGKVTTTRYFEATFKPDESLTLDKAVDEIEAVFEDSVNAHKISDVEVGCFLSSGVDSSYVSTYFADQKTFTVGFDFGDHYNEISWAKRLSEKIGVDHHTKLIGSDEFWGAVPKVQYQMDQPLADPSCIALYFVSKLASKYVKVVLSGEGADELFGGYTVYNEPHVFKLYQKIFNQKARTALANKARKMPHIKGRGFILRGERVTEEKFIGNAFLFDDKEKDEILKDTSIVTRPQDLCKKFYDRVRGYDDVTKMQYLDINLWMVGDILLKADRMSMANSLELRVPFLDRKVFEVARKLPTNLRVNRKNTKYAMRMAALRHLPKETAQKEKLGFPVPTRVWLRDEKFYNIVKDMFKSETAEMFFNTDILVELLDEHFHNKEDNSRKVWTIYVFLLWYNIYFGSDKVVPPIPENQIDD